MPQLKIHFNYYSILTEEEKALPSSKILQGRLGVTTYDAKDRQKWWDNLNARQKQGILFMPNFDKDIFL